ncbi:MAG TPA: SUMF1/EgtB/PvdO family nonheme iron enzyme [Candidatus Kapabacteria bacterium]|nr:SUMF1/EgtB/PvdO family nonheme iron enzyme [Candidatus Kapabacteria bacterium]
MLKLLGDWRAETDSADDFHPLRSDQDKDKRFNDDDQPVVDATTPVGRYPEGVTPEGLMDMAGNAWELIDNWYDKDKKRRALRGGSWDVRCDYLLCAARSLDNPWDNWYNSGFRVVCLFASGHTLR